MKQKFEPGQIVATPGALRALRKSVQGNGHAPLYYLQRHLSGDWGDVDSRDRAENERSLRNGWRLLSAYQLDNTGVRIWIITEADRSSTCILLPEEY